MRIVVTGAAGFIGSHLVEELVRLNHEVIAIDNLKTGKLSNLKTIINDIDFHEIDIRSKNLSDYFVGAKQIFHLAALADIVPSISDPYEYMEVNVMGTTRVLEAARSVGATRVIYAASSSCYGIRTNIQLLNYLKLVLNILTRLVSTWVNLHFSIG